MKNIFAFLIVLLAAFPLHAAELRIDKSVCQLVNKHVPDADVEYQPGRDATGRRVAPADIPGTQDHLEDQIVIRLTNDAAKVFGLNMPSIQRGDDKIPLAEAETNIGFVTLQNGKAYLDGKPLDASRQDELAVLCMQKK